MGQIPLPRAVAVIHIQAGARLHGNGSYGSCGLRCPSCPLTSWVEWVMPRQGRGHAARGRVRNGAGGARGVIWAKYPAGKNRSHTYTCYVITSHLEVHRLDDRRYPFDPVASTQSVAPTAPYPCPPTILLPWAKWVRPLAVAPYGLNGRAHYTRNKIVCTLANSLISFAHRNTLWSTTWIS